MRWFIDISHNSLVGLGIQRSDILYLMDLKSNSPCLVGLFRARGRGSKPYRSGKEPTQHHNPPGNNFHCTTTLSDAPKLWMSSLSACGVPDIQSFAIEYL